MCDIVTFGDQTFTTKFNNYKEENKTYFANFVEERFIS